MPEIPEIHSLARQMEQVLPGKQLQSVDIKGEKCLNLPPEAFRAAVCGQVIRSVSSHGKWIIWQCDSEDRLLLNLNMGGETVFYPEPGEPRKGWRLQLHFTDGSRLSIGFWWLGYFHFVPAGQTHPMADGLGVDVLSGDFTPQWLRETLKAKKKAVKSVLLDQRVMAGIGNYYIHDILFLAGIHPLRQADSLSAAECARLYETIRSRLEGAEALRGAAYERDLYDQPGGFAGDVIAYQEGRPCPRCGTPIEKIQTGSNAGYICPHCQRQKGGRNGSKRAVGTGKKGAGNPGVSQGT
ncbi:MAG: hypothetical protein PHD32_09445 [Eubacteriales bacterium]|nr:hypothetical protein [Eubacteriales bacterium]